MSKIAPAYPTVELSLGTFRLFFVNGNVFSRDCMAFIVKFICANYAITAELELVRNALACASTSSL